MILCACGCKTELNFSKGRKNKKYVKGHFSRVDNRGAKARKGISSWNKGISRTDEEKKNISHAIISAKKKSTYKFTDLHKINISNALKRKIKSKEWTNKILLSRENNPRYELVKQQISKTMKEKYKRGEIKSQFYIDGRWKKDPNSMYNQYGGDFTEELKQKIRLRDNWTCQLCSKLRSVHVHHIDLNKLNNHETNLIVLCSKCHAKHHHKSNVEFNNQKQLFEAIINAKYTNRTDV